MKKTQINPWAWQDMFGFSQAWKVDEARSLVIISGQASFSAEGSVMHDKDFEAQARLTFENLKTVLEAGGGSLGDVVKLGAFVTDMSNLETFGAVQAAFFPGPKPAQTLVEVSSLALPEMMIEVEAIAVV
jgi:enamine deaminase RidA (YjgF/YER057c/UK114 family)